MSIKLKNVKTYETHEFVMVSSKGSTNNRSYVAIGFWDNKWHEVEIQKFNAREDIWETFWVPVEPKYM